MAQKSDTWMAFYVGDYVANTLHLAREHHGSYLLLILAAFKNSGWLPNDDSILAQVAKCTPKQWKAERAMYARFFDVTNERWTHGRVEKELAKAAKLTEQRRLAGIESAAKRQREANDRSTTVDCSLQRNARPSEPQVQGEPLQGSPPEYQTSEPVAARGGLGGPTHDTASVLANLGNRKRVIQ